MARVALELPGTSMLLPVLLTKYCIYLNPKWDFFPHSARGKKVPYFLFKVKLGEKRGDVQMSAAVPTPAPSQTPGWSYSHSPTAAPCLLPTVTFPLLPSLSRGPSHAMLANHVSLILCLLCWHWYILGELSIPWKPLTSTVANATQKLFHSLKHIGILVKVARASWGVIFGFFA